MLYDPTDVLAHIDQHKAAIIGLCGLAMFFNYAWFISALRVGARQRSISLPLVCSTFWFAHDTSFVARYDKWFNHYGSWYTELFWVALVATSLMEVAFIAQAIRYGRQEWMPNASQKQWTAFVLGTVVVAVIVWTGFKQVMSDDLYLASFGLTVVAYPVLGIPMLLRRRSLRDQTRWMWGGYTGMSACWFTASSLWFGDFGGTEWTILGVTSVVLGAVMFVLVDRAKVAEARTPAILTAASSVVAAR